MSVGMQIIDAELYSTGIPRAYRHRANSFDSQRLIDETFSKVFS
jgi:hypothetical protein